MDIIISPCVDTLNLFCSLRPNYRQKQDRHNAFPGMPETKYAKSGTFMILRLACRISVLIFLELP